MNEDNNSMVLASTGQRFANYVLDLIFYFGLSFLLGVILALTGQIGVLEQINDYVFGLAIFLLYYVPQESANGRTFAKLITKTKVVNEDGTAPSVGRVIGRTLCRCIPFEPFSFLFGGNEPPRGWHDKISKTKVISLK